MDVIRDFGIGVPIGLLYSFFFGKLMEHCLSSTPLDERIGQSIVYLFVLAIITLAIGQLVFYSKSRLLYIAFMTGGLVLLFNSIISNWNKLTNVTKIGFIGAVLGLILFIAYKFTKKTKKNEALIIENENNDIFIKSDNNEENKNNEDKDHKKDGKINFDDMKQFTELLK